MPDDVVSLERRTVEFARAGDFGAAALEANRELARLAPSNQGAWTRLARCAMEQRQFDDAVVALARALELNPSNTIAKSLHQEVLKRRALTPVTSDAASGFTPQDFYTLGQLAPTDAARALAPKIESLLLSLNAQPRRTQRLEALSPQQLLRRDARPHLCLPSRRTVGAADQPGPVQRDAVGSERVPRGDRLQHVGRRQRSGA
jgi:tetratricopeptide (TPR) repeat protein